jgi:uncharacterized protein
LFGELEDLGPDHREALPVLAGTGRLDGRVEREQVRLVGDLVHDRDPLGDRPHRADRPWRGWRACRSPSSSLLVIFTAVRRSPPAIRARDRGREPPERLEARRLDAAAQTLTGGANLRRRARGLAGTFRMAKCRRPSSAARRRSPLRGSTAGTAAGVPAGVTVPRMASPRLARLLRRIIAARALVLAAYAVLVPAAVWVASRIPSEQSIDRLVVGTDPDVAATRAFQAVFPEPQLVLLLLEADDPFRPEVVAEARALAAALGGIPRVSTYSVLDVFRRARPGAASPATDAEALRRFATGTDFFRRQALVGDRFLGLAVALEVHGAAERDAALAAVDAALARTPHPAIRQIRRIGAPYVESWVERESGAATLRWFPVFGLLVVALTLFLYRSVRALVAILASLAAAVALGVAAGGLLGYAFTVVSALVPLTVMVTALATLVYLHSRYVDQPEDVPLADHQVDALLDKALPVTASTLAAACGFAALAVSRIRPIRELGLWTATGLAVSWAVAFTLFPALVRTVRAPTRRTVAIRAGAYERLAAALPDVTFRWRWPLLAGALALAAGGLGALTGIPGRVAPMRVGLDLLDYVDPSLPLHRDMVFFRDHVSGLGVARVWVRTPPGAVTDPAVLRGLERFTRAVEEAPGVTAVIGPTTFLRVRRYLAGQGDALPTDPAAFTALAGDLEQLLLTEPELRGFFDLRTLASAQLTVTFRDERVGYRALAEALRGAWSRTVGADPALDGVEMQVVGESLLQDKVGASLVPTLTESFAITATLIFAAFLFVFRSASARLMAMIPSVVAILATFLGMRLAGASLNLATILVATTVLGTTENDQIHFFHHLHQGEGPAGLAGALRHTLRVSGRAIVFATLINAGGFLGLALSSFPPLRQFGVVTASAFLLAMVADFTALPAALWIIRRERPRRAAARAPAPRVDPR